jgi:hypothetical protein
MKDQIKEIMFEAIEHVVGFNNKRPLGGTPYHNTTSGKSGQTVSDFFHSFLTARSADGLMFEKQASRAINSFVEFYSKESNYPCLIQMWEKFNNTTEDNVKAEILMKIFVPELDTTDSEVLKKWKLHDFLPNTKPYKPDEITIQLNSLYTLPEEIDERVPANITRPWYKISKENLTHIADYDHPVPIFAKDKHHELITCLTEMDQDIAFEKEKGVFNKDHKVIITLSISVTHAELDQIASRWVEWLIEEGHFFNLSIIILSEFNIKIIRDRLLQSKSEIFSVFGKYAVHFNALKYSQLLLEKAYKIRAGFKLDTDEGIRSSDLYRTTGKTWFQTLCHNYWGGTGKDSNLNDVYLGVNEGEYINSVDIDTHTYPKAYRMPEVKIPASFINQQIIFFKGYAQGYVTKLYNTFLNVEEGVSHPVVKGGGYGIDNHALKRFKPFALSHVGRAEDQQFYFSGLSKGIRGIFHPDLRIAHYKQSVQTSETKQKGTKFLGDMYRLLIFSHLITIINVKNEIDPFPGLFAGELSYFQYFFNLMYQTLCFSSKNNEEISSYLLETGLPELEKLIAEIESGKIKNKLEEEQQMWNNFVTTVDNLTTDEVKPILDTMKF